MMYLFIMVTISYSIPLIIILLTNVMYMRSNKDREKTSPFECGFDPMNSARLPFSTRFFLLAVIFIMFDIEIVLLTPIPFLILTSNKQFMLMTTSTFMLILMIGLFHEWMEGSLNWSK